MKKPSNIERHFLEHPDARRNAHGTRRFTVAMWNRWWDARQPDRKAATRREGIKEFRRLLARPADSVRE